jgi:ADP-ribose pyrophosphatase YjhB (NUDIX family)
MKLFINDKPLTLLDPSVKVKENLFDVVINEPSDFDGVKLKGNVLINDVSSLHLSELLKVMRTRKLKKLKSITLTGSDYKALCKLIKKPFKIIKAAGGLIKKDDRFLMIYRLKKWDLPKGKLDEGEKSKIGAVREVEEECNISVTLGPKVCTTWHTYVYNHKSILKKTKWYLMDCVDDSAMAPQLEEDIEDIRWMTTEEVKVALENSYRSISEVFNCYIEQVENEANKQD